MNHIMSLSSTRIPTVNFNMPRLMLNGKPRVIISRFLDPYVNLSIGTYLSRKVGSVFASRMLFLCSSHQGVFIGKNQNCWKECNMQKMKEDAIPLVRRDTGGGACFVDGGNRLFGFIEANGGILHKDNFSIVVNALNSLDLNGKAAVMQGGNDICIENKKISGSAFSLFNSVFRHHGTILIDVDKDKLQKYLTPSKIKLESKGIKSVQARICNLTDINPIITSEMFDHALIRSYLKPHESSEVLELNERNFSQIIEDNALFMEIFTKNTSRKFLYNQNPEFTHKIEKRFSFGIVEILLTCENNFIQDCQIFSDSLDLAFINALKKVFKGKEYSFEGIEKIHEELGNANHANEFCDYLKEVI